MADEHKAARDALIAELGLTLTATFVPQSKSRYAIGADKRSGGYDGKGAPCINWRVSLSRPGAMGHIWETDYSHGAGHLPPAYSRQAAALACETGATVPYKPLQPPTIDDVLYSLLMDGQADEETFEDWAANFGYDVDSRKAYATYETCRDTGAALRRHLGADNVARLRELFSDY